MEPRQPDSYDDEDDDMRVRLVESEKDGERLIGPEVDYRPPNLVEIGGPPAMTMIIEGEVKVLDNETLDFHDDQAHRKGGRGQRAMKDYRPIAVEVGKEMWERLPHESIIAYRAFVTFRNQGVRRSLRGAQDIFYDRDAEHLTRTVTRRFVNWSSKFFWRKRAEAWDEHLMKLEDEAWEGRERLLRQKEWDASDLLFAKAMTALDSIDLEKVELTPQDIVRLLKLASDLGQRTKQEPISADAIGIFMTKLPTALRDRVIGLLQAPDETKKK